MLQPESFYKGREVDFYKHLVKYAQGHDLQNKKTTPPSGKSLDAISANSAEADAKLIEALKEEALKILQPSIRAATPQANLNFLQGANLQKILNIGPRSKARIENTSSSRTNLTSSRTKDPSSSAIFEDAQGKDSEPKKSQEWEEFDTARDEFVKALDECATDILQVSRDNRVQPSTYEKVVHTMRNVALALTCALAAAGISLALKSNNRLLGYVVTPDKILKGSIMLSSVSCLGTISTLLDSISVRESDDDLMKVISIGHKTLDNVQHHCKEMIRTLNLAEPGRERGC